MKLIAQGAEAKIFQDKDKIIKDRVSKSYRHPELDKTIIKRRTKSETKLLIKAAQIINAPIPETSKEKHQIVMPFIDGEKLSVHLSKKEVKDQKKIMKEVGKSIAKIHKEDIIHGDLTTSNMILQDKKIFLIDFGLGYISQKLEDKAVDLHLLKQALEAKHFETWETLIAEVFKAYEKEYDQAFKVFERVKAVEKRGRYRH